MARILSPLALFLSYIIYLAVWSRDPFLKKWLDGSFAFFMALVLANIIRARIAASGRGEDTAGGGKREGDASADGGEDGQARDGSQGRHG
jgi:hypothetical protein